MTVKSVSSYAFGVEANSAFGNATVIVDGNVSATSGSGTAYGVTVFSEGDSSVLVEGSVTAVTATGPRAIGVEGVVYDTSVNITVDGTSPRLWRGGHRHLRLWLPWRQHCHPRQ